MTVVTNSDRLRWAAGAVEAVQTLDGRWVFTGASGCDAVVSAEELVALGRVLETQGRTTLDSWLARY